MGGGVASEYAADFPLIINKEDVTKKIESIINTQLLQKYKIYLNNALFEYPLSIPFLDNFIYGIIDCLIQNEENNWEIWDWKTNYIANTTRQKELTENYRLQLELYIYILMHLYPKQQVYTARLLFTDLAMPNIADQFWTGTIILTKNDKNCIVDKLSEKISRATLKVSG